MPRDPHFPLTMRQEEIMLATSAKGPNGLITIPGIVEVVHAEDSDSTRRALYYVMDELVELRMVEARELPPTDIYRNGRTGRLPVWGFTTAPDFAPALLKYLRPKSERIDEAIHGTESIIRKTNKLRTRK